MCRLAARSEDKNHRDIPRPHTEGEGLSRIAEETSAQQYDCCRRHSPHRQQRQPHRDTVDIRDTRHPYRKDYKMERYRAYQARRHPGSV